MRDWSINLRQSFHLVRVLCIILAGVAPNGWGGGVGVGEWVGVGVGLGWVGGSCLPEKGSRAVQLTHGRFRRSAPPHLYPPPTSVPKLQGHSTQIHKDVHWYCTLNTLYNNKPKQSTFKHNSILSMMYSLLIS